MKLDLNDLGLSLAGDDSAKFTQSDNNSFSTGVSFGSKTDDIIVRTARVSRLGTLAVHGTRSAKPIFSGVENVNNVHVEHLNVIFNRSAFAQPNRLMLEESLKHGIDDGESTIFSHRTRVQIGSVHILKSDAHSLIALNKLTIDDPMCIRFLADREERSKVLDLISSDELLNDLVKFLIGTSGRAKTGTKRFTMHRLVNWLRKRDDKPGKSSTNSLTYVVGSVILRHILEQLDWEFATLETVKIEEVSSRLLGIEDLETVYTEGWLTKVLPTTGNWVMKYNGSAEVTSSALFEVLSGSLVALRKQLMNLNLLHKRFADVVNAAKVACALNHGLVEDIANETLLAFATSSQAIQDMASWSSIVLDLFGNGFSDVRNGILATKVGDVSLLRSFADDLVAAVRAHSLVETMSPGDYVKHIGVRHYATESGLRYHTTVFGNIERCKPSTHYIEANLGANVFGVTVVKENAAFNDEVADFYSTTASAAVDMLSDLDSVHSLYNLSTFEQPEDVINSGSHGFTAIGVYSRDVMLLALMQNEVLVRYRRNDTAVVGVSFLDIIATYFVLHNVATSAANPFPVFDDAVYTQSCVLAVCMGTAKDATGSSPLLRADVEMESAAYVVTNIESMISLNRVAVVPSEIKHNFTIQDLKRQDLHVPIAIDLNRYLTLSAFDTTKTLIARNLDLYRSLVEYALEIAAEKLDFTSGRVNYAYDMERLHANFLAKYVSTAAGAKFTRSILQAMRFDAAVIASSQFGSLSNAVHNIALNNHCVLFGVGVPAMIAFNTAEANRAVTLQAAYDNNRLFKDYMMNLVVKGYN